MKGVVEYLVSASGQMSLPADARRRWKVNKGGPVDVIDLGYAVMVMPPGEGRKMLADLLSSEDHAAFVEGLRDDPDLATT